MASGYCLCNRLLFNGDKRNNNKTMDQLISDEMFCQSDYYTMQNLWKRIPRDSDYELIHLLYRKYIQKDAPFPISGCGSCGLSVYRYYDKLREYWCSNGDRFKK